MVINPTKPSRLSRLWPWLAVLAAIGFAGFIRFRLAELPLERDEGEYAYAGQLLLQGVPPYQAAYNMKFPGTYLVYAGFFGVLGESVRAIRLGLLLTTSLSTILVFLIGRKCADSTVGATAAWAYALLSANASLFALAAHATHFVVLFMLVAVLLLLNGREGRSAFGRVAVAGAALGVATMMKQHAVFFLLLAAGLIIWPMSAARPRLDGRAFRSLICLGCGFAIPLVGMFLWLWATGVFERFWFWTVTYAREYVSNIPISRAPYTFAEMARGVFPPSWLLWAWAVGGAVLGWREVALRRTMILLLVWLMVSFLAICPGYVFRNHYFLLLVPSVALLIGVAVRQATLWFQQGGPRARLSPWLMAGLLLAGILSAVANWEVWFLKTPDEASRRIYGEQGFVECRDLAERIRTISAPEDRIAVIGSEPQIYFLAQRPAATGYLYTYAFTEPQPYARRMQLEMIEELERTKPKYVVFVKSQVSWLPRPDSDRTLVEWWKLHQAAHYALIGTVDFPQPASPTDQPGPAAAAESRREVSRLLLYQRKPMESSE